MDRRRLLAGGLALTAGAPALAQTPAAAPRVGLSTDLGVIVLELAAARAPLTVANFLRYADDRRFDGAVFYRAMKLSPSPPSGLIQGGLENDPARVLPPVAHESTTQTGLRHRDGTISMARYAPGTAASEFFVCIGDQPSLDADPTQSGDNLGFAAFGQVVDGMDVVRKVLASPTSPTEGEGEMKGQMLDPKIKIFTARRA